MGVTSRAPVRREGNPGAFAAEYLIELVDELGIPIMDGEPDWSLQLVQLPGQVSGLLGLRSLSTDTVLVMPGRCSSSIDDGISAHLTALALRIPTARRDRDVKRST